MSTLERLDAAIVDQVITDSGFEPSRLLGAAALRPSFLRLLAWAVLESDGLPRLGELCFGRMLVERLQDEGLSERDSLVAASQAM